MASAPEIDVAPHPSLAETWSEHDPHSLSCCKCGRLIGSEALVRTFKVLFPPEPTEGESDEVEHCSRTIVTRQGLIVVYDRHFDCIDEKDYVTVSHVWDRRISEVQNAERKDQAVETKEEKNDNTEEEHWIKGHGPERQANGGCKEESQGSQMTKEQPGEDFEEARRLAFEMPMRMYCKVTESIKERVEMWHDYISVPQWEWELKMKILPKISEIFKKARFTLVHMHDVSRESVNMLESGRSPEERLEGAIRICNSFWFSRVWTAMEYIRSNELQIMVKDEELVGGARPRYDLFSEMIRQAWRDGEAKYVSKIGVLEPWQLGPIHLVKEQGRTEFGPAFTVLSRRHLKKSHDFYYNLNALVASPPKEPLDSSDHAACLQIVRSCLAAGDYTPLLMSPKDVLHIHDDSPRKYGYNDVVTWGMGVQVSRPSIQDGLTMRSGKLFLKAERMGSVHFIHTLGQMTDSVADPLHIALFFTGSDVDAYAETVGSRLFGQTATVIHRRLSQDGRQQRVQKMLELHYNFVKHANWSRHAYSIADEMGLWDTQLPGSPKGTSSVGFMEKHGGTLHLDLNNALVAMTCPVCMGTFLFRAALYRPPKEIRGAIGYRIPGLAYSWTLPDGIGLLVKEGKVLGRFIWACRACPCWPELLVTETEISLETFHLPEPRTDS